MIYDDDEDDVEDEKERKRLQGMSVEQLKVVFDERLKACIIEEIMKMPETVKEKLDAVSFKIIATTLGIKKGGWHDSQWELEDGNASALPRALGKHVLTQIKLAIPDFIEGLVVGDPRIPPIKTAYTKAYKEHLGDLVHSKIWEVAQTNAQKRFIEIMEQIGGEKVEIELTKIDQVEMDEGDEEEEKEEA